MYTIKVIMPSRVRWVGLDLERKLNECVILIGKKTRAKIFGIFV
jgi:hypothetical protein